MACGAEHGVALLLVLESGAIKQLAIALSVHSSLGRHVRQNAFAFASCSLFTVGVTGIGYHMESAMVTRPRLVAPLRPWAADYACHWVRRSPVAPRLSHARHRPPSARCKRGAFPASSS